MADWLVVTERGTLPIVVKRYVGGFTSTPLSAAFGVLLGAEGSNDSLQQGGAIHIDATTIYAVTYTGLYRSTDSGATLSQVYAFVGPSGVVDDAINHGGVHYIYDDNNQEAYLAGWWKTNTNALTGWRYRLSDGAASQTTGPVVSNSHDSLGGEIRYGSIIHLQMSLGGSGGDFYSWDPLGQSWATYSEPFDSRADMDFAVAPDGKLYALTLPTTNQYRLSSFTGSWGDVGTIEGTPGTPTTNSGDNARCALFSDGTDLYAVSRFSTTGASVGWRMRRIPTPFNLVGMTDVSATVLPTALRPTNDGGTANGNGGKRCLVVQDTQSTPGTLRTFLLFADTSTPGTPWGVWEFVGPGSPLVFVGTGGAVRDSIPRNVTSGGGRFYTPGQRSVRITQVAPTNGGEIISFIGSGGGTGVVRFRRNDKQQGAEALGTLVGPVTGGGALGTNEVTGVTLDGTTVNTVTWNFFVDGFSASAALTVLDPEVT